MQNGTLSDLYASHSTSTNLLKRVVEGDEEAWVRFVSIYGAFIYARCRHCGVLPQDAADVLQNVLKRVHGSIATLRRDEPGKGLRPWLWVMARNVINDHFRTLQRERETIGSVPFPQVVEELTTSEDENSNTCARGSELVFLIRSALEAIQIDYEHKTWQAFWRTVVEEQSAVEVAQDLGIAAGSVRQARYKIIKRLREELHGLL